MKQYRRISAIIEAQIFDGTDESVEWIYPQLQSNDIARGHLSLYIRNSEGVMTADIGDYVIKYSNGEFYPCKAHIFESTYEECK